MLKHTFDGDCCRVTTDDYGRSPNPIRESIHRLNKYSVGDVFEDSHRSFSISCAPRTRAWTLLLELGRMKSVEPFTLLHRFCLSLSLSNAMSTLVKTLDRSLATEISNTSKEDSRISSYDRSLDCTSLTR